MGTFNKKIVKAFLFSALLVTPFLSVNSIAANPSSQIDSSTIIAAHGGSWDRDRSFNNRGWDGYRDRDRGNSYYYYGGNRVGYPDSYYYGGYPSDYYNSYPNYYPGYDNDNYDGTGLNFRIGF